MLSINLGMVFGPDGKQLAYRLPPKMVELMESAIENDALALAIHGQEMTGFADLILAQIAHEVDPYKVTHDGREYLRTTQFAHLFTVAVSS